MANISFSKTICKVIFVFLVSIAFYFQSSSQTITNYASAYTAGTFTQLTTPTNPSLSGGTVNDGYFNNIPIGFEFWYMGNRYTTLSASTNGWLTLGAAITNSTPINNLTSGGAPRPVIAPLWDDLDLQLATNISYKTTGTAGTRVFTIEWLNVQWNPFATGTTMSFQVLLYEQTGRIRFSYRSEAGFANAPSASVGITNTTTGSGNFLSVNNSAAVSSTFESSVTTKPPTGTTFDFTPPLANAPTNLGFSQVTGTSMKLRWSDNSTNERVFQIFRSTDGINYTYVSQTAADVAESIQTGLTSGTTYYWKVYAVTETGSMPVSGSQKACTNTLTQIPSTNLIGYYELDGNANDVNGNNNGILMNNPTASADRFGVAAKAYTFNGTNQYMATENSYTGPSNFTISLWFKTTTTTGGKLIGFGNSQTGSSGSYDRHIYMNNVGQVYFGVYPGMVKTINSTASYNDGQWHLATATLSSTAGVGMRLYIDGVQVAADATTTTAQAYTGYWRVVWDNMSGWPSPPTATYYDGQLDDILIYHRALSAAEVNTIYKSPDGAGNNGPLCWGSTLNLTATTVPGASYLWSGPAGFTSTSQNPSFTASSTTAGVYNVQATANGCTTTAYTTVGISSTSSAISYSGSPFCRTGTAAVTRTGATGGTYSSTAGLAISSTTGTITLSSSTAGTYTVTYSIAGGCSSTTSVTINPNVAAPTFALGATSSRCVGAGSATYSASATGSTSITYALDATSLAAGNSINSTNGTVTFTAAWSGTSTITATAAGCFGPTSSSHVVTTNVIPTATTSTTNTCVGGATGTITINATGGTTPYTYSFNGGAYQASATFTGLSAATYSINVRANSGCIFTTTATVSPFADATDNQNTAGTDSWIGHVYDGIAFNNYMGQSTEAENFNQSFGGTATCYNLTSASGARSIYTESFSVKYRMNSTKNGLYMADLGSDDGGRLTIDGTLVYNSWVDQGFVSRPRVLMPLNGSSSLLYEFYESGGGNQVAFQNLTLVFANQLSGNVSQSICNGNAGVAISGDVFGVLPTGITVSGTGYQWSYSTTPGGVKIDIAGATSATFTPSAAAAPFNVPGTYYIYRKAILSSTNNISPNPFVATHISNEATLVVNPIPAATINYSSNPYCNAGSASVNRTGTDGGSYTSTAGLVINASTGEINLAGSTAGSYVVTYTIAANGGCSVFTTTANVDILPPTLPAPAAITGSSTICNGTTGLVYSISAVANATSYNWTVPIGWTITSGAGTTSITVNAGPAGDISVTAANSCVTSIATTLSVGIFPVEVVATSGSVAACYPNLKGAFDKINDGTHKGDITIKIIGSTIEPVAASLNASATGNALYTSVNIYPTENNLSITGSLNTPLITLNGADNVTIDGRVNATGSTKSLLLSNTSTGTAAATIRFINAAENNYIKYTIVKGASMATAGGVIHFSTATTPGNINNILEYNDIAAVDENNRPISLIYSVGSATFTNRNITVSNNNFYNFFATAATSQAINIGGNSSDWTISNNNFYQPTTFVPANTAVATFCGIKIANTTGANFDISNNYIGGSAPQNGGSPMTIAGGTINGFRAMDVSVSLTTPSSIQNNTISNINYTGDTTLFFYGMFVTGNVNIGTITGNTIGSATGTGSITLTNADATVAATSYGIYINSTSEVNVANNTIGSITTVSSGVPPHSFIGIGKRAATGTTTITNNLIGSITTPNSINASTSTTGAAQNVYGINSLGTGTITISGNTVANLNNNYSPVTSTTGVTAGIINTGTGINTVQNNTIYNLTSSALVTGATTSPSVVGISEQTTGAGKTISGNTIYNLSNTSATGAVSVTGLYYAGSVNGTNSVSNNFIHSLSASSSGTTANIFGMRIASGATTYSNNIISIGTGVTTGYNMYGVYETGAATNNNNLYFNTIYLGGNVSGSSSLTYALYNNANTNQRDFRNNNFVNARSSASTNQHFAIRIAGTTGLTLDYNNYYANGTAGTICRLNTTNHANLATWLTALSAIGADSNSVNLDPLFANAGGTNAANYTSSQILNGVPGTGIITDYFGATRIDLPKMGAVDCGFVAELLATTAAGRCGTGSVTLSVIASPGAVVTWFDAPKNGNVLATGTSFITPSISTTTTYYVQAIYPGCRASLVSPVVATVTPLPSATISFAGTPYCSSAGTATITLTGTTGGVFSANAGLILNATTGEVNLASSTAGTYTVTYTIEAAGACSQFSTTTTITITTQPFADGYYAGSPYCAGPGIVYPTALSIIGALGTITGTPGLVVDANGGVNLATSTPGNHIVTYTVDASGGCGVYTKTTPIIITPIPNASISYSAGTLCTSQGSVAVTRTGTAGGTYSSTAGLTIDANTGTITTSASTPGNYTVTYNVAAAGGCSSFSTTTNVTISVVGIWTGTANTDWNNAANWICSTVPDSSINVIIPASLSNYPLINTALNSSKNLTIQSGASVTVTNGTIRIAGSITNNGTFTATNGTVVMNGSVPQTIPASTFVGNQIKNLTINNTAGVTLGGTLSLTDVLTVSGGTFNAAGHLILKSTATATARVAPVTSLAANPITGNVKVERYIPGRRKYRIITSSVSTSAGATLIAGQEAQSIWGNWQNSGNNVAGLGNYITGGTIADGFDQQTTVASVYTYDDVNRKFVGFTSANGKNTKYTPLKAGVPYYMFVYGDRTNSIITATPGNTLISSTGTLLTGDQTYNSNSSLPLSNVPGRFTMVGNPFASPIDWSTISKTNIAATYWGWDPNLSSTGGYVTVTSAGTATLIAPFSGTTGLNQYIQPGQGFFVQTTDASPQMIIKEQDKVDNFNPNAFRTRNANDVPLLAINILYDNDGTATLADGVLAAYDRTYPNTVGKEDAIKMVNAAENISILNGNELLSIDARKLPQVNDTLRLNILRLKRSKYTLQIFAQQLETHDAAPYLEDTYLKTTNALSVVDTNWIDFNVDIAKAATFAPDRFRIVYRKAVVSPITFIAVSATQKNNDAQVQWNVQEDKTVRKYEVEFSEDNRSFSKRGEVIARASGNKELYEWMDTNPAKKNYYRIRSVHADGSSFVSKSVLVQINIAEGGIKIYPNPVTTNVINVQLNNLEKGEYKMLLIDARGAQVLTKTVDHIGGYSVQQIQMASKLNKGIYYLRVIQKKTTYTQTVMVQ